MTIKSVILYAALLSFQLNAQVAPKNWFNLDPETDNVNGVSTERAYKELLKGKTPVSVIVGVIDSGVDYLHEDLKDVMWTNTKEIPNNGKDDDKNGYIDDIHGWNFIGGKDKSGKPVNVNEDNLELARVYAAYKSKYEGKIPGDFKSTKEQQECELYRSAKVDLEQQRNQINQLADRYLPLYDKLSALNDAVKKSSGKSKITATELQAYTPANDSEKENKERFGKRLANTPDLSLDDLLASLQDAVDYINAQLKYNLNPDLNTRTIVGDNYNNSAERFYGNADCKGPESFHGTHVAGIIGAKRNNGIGMDGICDAVQIMSIRAVPNGDERDKDVANAIRYAVDNGAKIINMSFGKKYPWDKKAVDDAVAYAHTKGVLLIHAAGNDHVNIDSVAHYPCKTFLNGKQAENFIDIGALHWKQGDNMVADFSNYGKRTVDVFAPGVDIYSTAPENEYKNASGTSMACPVTAGVAAVLKAYFPHLTATQIKDILLKSANTKYSNMILNTGAEDASASPSAFNSLSKTGGIINLYAAIKLAETYKK